jgi:hypothetical protein
MRPWFAPIVLLLAACSSIDEPASEAVIDQFHGALNRQDWPAIDGLLTQSTRNLRPGGGTARSFRNITARHGRYLGGELAGMDEAGGVITVAWAARYERGPVSELFMLKSERGVVKIDGYTDNPAL